MDAGVPIVVFGEDWGRHPSTSQHLAKELSRRTTILWVNSLGLRTPRLSPSDLTRIARKLKDFLASARGRAPQGPPPPTNIHVLAPIAIPLPSFRLVRAINRILVGRHIRRAMARLGIRSPHVVVTSLAAVDLMGAFDHGALVYYCGDDYASLPGMDRDLVATLEREAFRKADVAIVTSLTLLEAKGSLHPRVSYLPHGVAYEGFRSAVTREHARPAVLHGIPAPIVGFVGLIGEHIDLELVESVAASVPEASFVMVGPIEEGTRVPKRENITYTGAVPHEELPGYLAHFDVCIVPYVRDSPRIRFASPTKVREYLAAGRPVVSTPQLEARQLGPDVTFADSTAEFAAAIRARFGTSEAERRRISDSMADHSWVARADRFREILAEAAPREGAAAR